MDGVAYIDGCMDASTHGHLDAWMHDYVHKLGKEQQLYSIIDELSRMVKRPQFMAAPQTDGRIDWLPQRRMDGLIHEVAIQQTDGRTDASTGDPRDGWTDGWVHARMPWACATPAPPTNLPTRETFPMQHPLQTSTLGRAWSGASCRCGTHLHT
eukprot:334155-Chlamydomonas_euryale.AAC.5